MNILPEISKMTTIDINSLMDRLKKELSVKNKDIEMIYYAIFDIFNIILGITHQRKVNNQMYTIAYRMIIDYWYLNGYDKKMEESKTNYDKDSKNSLPIKSIAIGDTTTTFEDTSSKIEINGVHYDTEAVNIAEDIITEKYKKRLYKFRKMRW
ncbi:MAG: hypothetical protein IKM97_05010 [Clostridia bacterium]|nr:hypothetical protein [Clostridia bacterium]